MPNPTHHIDESPIRFDRLVQSLPNWLQRFLPIGGGIAHDHHGKGMFGVTVFLLSESLVFLSFFFKLLHHFFTKLEQVNLLNVHFDIARF